MTLTPYQLGRVRVARAHADFTKLLFDSGSAVGWALVFAKRKGGLLLVVPPDVIPAHELEDASQDSYRGIYGPCAPLTVEQPTADGVAEEVDLIEIVVVDMKAGVARYLETYVEEEASGDEVAFVDGDGANLWPNVEALRAVVEPYLASMSEEARITPYCTASEGAATAEGAASSSAGGLVGDGAAAEPKAAREKPAIPKHYQTVPPKTTGPASTDEALRSILASTRALTETVEGIGRRVSGLEKGNGKGLQVPPPGTLGHGLQLLAPPFGKGKSLGGQSLLPAPPPRLKEVAMASPGLPPGSLDPVVEEEDAYGLDGVPAGLGQETSRAPRIA